MSKLPDRGVRFVLRKNAWNSSAILVPLMEDVSGYKTIYLKGFWGRGECGTGDAFIVEKVSGLCEKNKKRGTTVSKWTLDELFPNKIQRSEYECLCV